MPNDETIVTPPSGDDDAGSGANANGDAGTNNGDGDQDAGVDWKAKFEEEQGRRERAETKLEKLAKKPDPDTNKAPSKSSELDYGQLAFYNTKSDVVKIESQEDIDFLQKTLSETGKSQSELLNAKWFQNELKERRDAQSVQNAIPDGSKRSNQSASNTVEYWLAKGELPPADQRELRTQVVNARLKAENNKSQFTDNPVVGK